MEKYKIIENGIKYNVHESDTGDKHWIYKGNIHRELGPAIEHSSGDKWWYKNGILHREDGPAIEFVNGNKWWYKNGIHHREDGPAVILFGTEHYWLNGVYYPNVNSVNELIIASIIE